jgi:hypothetical protein
MKITSAEILIVGPLLGAASALLGAWLGPLASANLEERRYRRQLRTEVYTKWLQFTENLATWALEPGADFVQTFLPKLHDMQAEVTLVSSRSVSRAMQDYIDRLDPGLEAVLQSTSGLSDPHQIAYAAGVAFGRVMEEPRRKVLNAMRTDLGFEALDE